MHLKERVKIEEIMQRVCTFPYPPPCAFYWQVLLPAHSLPIFLRIAFFSKLSMKKCKLYNFVTTENL